VHKEGAANWENNGFPSFHGPYDYDVLKNERKQKQVGPRPAWGKGSRGTRNTGIPRIRETANITAEPAGGKS
jgi:hypothetical protein